MSHYPQKLTILLLYSKSVSSLIYNGMLFVLLHDHYISVLWLAIQSSIYF